MFKNLSLIYFICVPWFLSCQTQASQTQRQQSEGNQNETVSSNSISSFTKSAEISLEYQKSWFAMLHKDKCDESWGLFSQGGFTNRGQTIVIRINQEYLVYVESSNQEEKKFIYKQKLMTQDSDYQLFAKAVAKKYQDFSPKAFDALKREFVQVHCKDLNQENFEPLRTKFTHIAKPKLPDELSELVNAFEKLREIKD